ncbi:MAG: excinuclease ABC subunit UvrC [Candidatus Binatia bacterium]|nr:excinuclease ABC subunit UvrC [Candidatus Binatia bacterium]MDG2011069.1 excinuclease ABC subunit UvrC [Candidatus Binatia bacterium]HAC81379.1 excinuclease ABC subunit C [Deltaproteobacteria bacterium]
MSPSAGGDVSEALAAQGAAAPPRPGVYLFKDDQARVIYVGKAKNLRSRLGSYMRGGDGRQQIVFLLRKATQVECLVTRNEKEALILENNLIKQYKPRYNIRLKDDKSYVSVAMTKHAWPRVVVTRRIRKDGARYFGPFHSASSVRETLDVVRKVFPLRTCSDAVFRNRQRPCLEHQIGRCLAPCVLPVDREDYEGHLRQVALLLEGRNEELVAGMEREMQLASSEERFEEAAKLRDRLRSIRNTAQGQEVLQHDGGDQDVFGFYREGGFAEVQILIVRAGRLVANRSFGFRDWNLPEEELIGSVLTQFYGGGHPIPPQILLPVELADADAREEMLTERLERRVRIVAPQRGRKKRMVDLAGENARQALGARRGEDERQSETAEELRRRLRLRSAPRTIECVDISTFQGSSTVASVVAFDDGAPATARYRRYRIRTVEGTDDFASMAEVLGRRFRAGIEADDLPDLLVVDGGRGQLGVALAALADLGLDSPEIVGLAKSRARSDARSVAMERSEERVFLPGRVNPVVLPRSSGALFLLQRVRDEAHRFAITYHRSLRQKAARESPLDAVAGIGPERKKLLLRHFGSMAGLRRASIEEIAALAGIGKTLARTIVASIAED